MVEWGNGSFGVVEMNELKSGVMAIGMAGDF